MNRDDEEYISKCDVCKSYLVDQRKEPLICHEKTSRPWEKVAVDMFELDGKHYLITVDYFSGFFEVDRLQTKSASELLKS